MLWVSTVASSIINSVSSDFSGSCLSANMSSYSGKRLCDMMDDGLDDFLSQAVDRCEKEFDLDDGLDRILSQSLDIFEQKSLDYDAIDITDMFDSGGPSLGSVGSFSFHTDARVENIYFILKECLKRTKVD